jgi:hypothetical protein
MNGGSRYQNRLVLMLVQLGSFQILLESSTSPIYLSAATRIAECTSKFSKIPLGYKNIPSFVLFGCYAF